MQLKSKQLCGPKKEEGTGRARGQEEDRGRQTEKDKGRGRSPQGKRAGRGWPELMEMRGPAPGLRQEQEGAVHLHSMRLGHCSSNSQGRNTDHHSEALLDEN